MDEAEGDPLSFVEEPFEPPEIQDSGRAAQHCRDDARIAGQPTGFSRADGLAGVEASRLDLVAQLLLVDGHHDGGGGPRVQMVGRQVLDELAEGQPASMVPVGARPRLVADLRRARAEAAATRRRHGVEDPAQQLAVQGGEREVTGDRAVVVVVERQAGPSPRGCFFVDDELVLVGVDLGLVRLDGGQGPTSGAPQGLGRQALGLRHQLGLDPVALGIGDGRGQLPCGPDDHVSVLCRDGTIGQSLGGAGPVDQPDREADLSMGGGLVAVGHLGHPLPGAHGPARSRRTGLLCCSQQLHPDRADLGLRPTENPQQVSLLHTAQPTRDRRANPGWPAARLSAEAR